MGYGGMGGGEVAPQYYGPSGEGIANAFEQNYQRKRQQTMDEADLAAKGEQLHHAQAMDPLEEALKGRDVANAGIVRDQSPGAPPAGSAAPPPTAGGDRLPPITMGNDHALVQPSGATGTVEGTAHALPGAFNPVTGVHNPADINLGGGFTLSGDETTQGKRRRDAGELMNSGIAGMTPELALYLADHPEHVAGLLGKQYDQTPKEYHPTTEDEAVDYYHRTHPHAGESESGGRGPAGLTMEQALQQVDEMYGTKDPVSGERASDMSPDARLRTAQQIYEGKGGLPRSKRFGTNPVDFGQGGGNAGPTSKRHITKDQADYLKSKGGFDPQKYIVDDED